VPELITLHCLHIKEQFYQTDRSSHIDPGGEMFIISLTTLLIFVQENQLCRRNVQSEGNVELLN
jgi:hypothetical protein